MQRFIRLSLLMILVGLFGTVLLKAAPQAYVSGTIAAEDVRVFLKDSTYIIDNDLNVLGTVIVEPGTEVQFYPNSRIIIEAGGRFIADGSASASYEEGNSQNPLSNSNGYYGYADPGYFLGTLSSAGSPVLTVKTVEEFTVSRMKENIMWNVLYDTLNKRILDLPEEYDNSNQFSRLDGNAPLGEEAYYDSYSFIISYEQAMMLKASRISNYGAPMNDPGVNIKAWTRIGGSTVDITPATITFRGQPALNASREWGHFVVLPGARAAFFRDCEFINFRKEITVDRRPFYDINDFHSFDEMNNKMNKMTNGAGGAISTLSSRTWLLDCSFENNMARLRGGAIQFLEAPHGYFEKSSDYIDESDAVNYYPFMKNPQVVDNNRDYSDINSYWDDVNANGVNDMGDIYRSNVLRIDNIDDDYSIEPLSDFERQEYDDARLAIYLGRVRNLSFDGNYTLISDTEITGQGVVDDTNKVATKFNTQGLRFMSGGGAIFISSNREAPFGIKCGHDGSYMEVALGCNDKIMINHIEKDLYDVSPNGYEHDGFVADHNFSKSYASSGEGSMGGAIYLSYGSSLIFSGELDDNHTLSPYQTSPERSRGGAIFVENCPGARLQIRGNRAKVESSISNPTHITNNSANLGGAIFVDGYANKIPPSPIIGGTDDLIATRDWGYDITFEGNYAHNEGGAIYTTRQMFANGAGGVEGNTLLGYGGLYSVKFYDNQAVYAGGAIKSFIPPYDYNGDYLNVDKKLTKIYRTEFIGNHVGFSSLNEDGSYNRDVENIGGGGAIYGVYTELSEIKATLFQDNNVLNGNGGAIALIEVEDDVKNVWVTDLDVVSLKTDGRVDYYSSMDDVFTHDNSNYPADVRMMTRFINNVAHADTTALDSLNGSGTTQMTSGVVQPTQNLFAVSTPNNGNALYTAGANGMVMRLTNEGTDWDEIKMKDVADETITATIEDIYFTTSSHGFMCGAFGYLAHTIDGGYTWDSIQVDLPSGITSFGTWKDIDFNGTQFGYGITNQAIFMYSDNGGDHWEATKISEIGGAGYNCIKAVSRDLVIVAGENGAILQSTDGGANWNDVSLVGTTNDYYSIEFISATVGFIVGSDGMIVRTLDGGLSWQEIQSGGETLHTISFGTNMIGYAFGRTNTAYKTIDAGATWMPLTITGPLSHWFASHFIGDMGWIVGSTGKVMITKDAGASWTELKPYQPNGITIDVKRFNPDIPNLPENGIGLGGAVYVADSRNFEDVPLYEIQDPNMFVLNRVRMIENEAYTGSAVYSDNYNVKFVLNRSLVTKNKANSLVGDGQNVINGPYVLDPLPGTNINESSSDLAPATFYAEVQGPIPAYEYSEAANSLYDNDARFLIRLPDAPNTKGLLAGGAPGIGSGGTDTLRGNYWGETQANVTMDVSAWDRNNNTTKMETFFVNGDPMKSWLPFIYNPLADDAKVADDIYKGLLDAASFDYKNQGPFESINKYMYVPIPLVDDALASIPEDLLFSSKIYDIYDKGTDIKTADYSKRRMSPIEDFAVGIPPKLKYFGEEYEGQICTPYPDASFQGETRSYGPVAGKYVMKWTRNPHFAELRDGNDFKYGGIHSLQRVYFSPDSNGVDHHPIGYPLYLQANVDYSGDDARSNHNDMFLNETVFFVINESNNDFIRVNLKQLGETDYREVFRNTVELVPDESLRPNSSGNIYRDRRDREGLKTLGNGADILRELSQDPYDEDWATLQGRKYHADYTNVGMNHNIPEMVINNLFSNRDDMPTTNVDPSVTVDGRDASMVTYFAGERYKALPVKVGDLVRVISRTALWRISDLSEIDAVMEDGLTFVVSESTDQPYYTGDVVDLQNKIDTIIVPSDKPWVTHDTIVVDEFQNRIFVKEDSTYSLADNNPILTVTAIDTVDMYHPGSVWDPATGSELTYEWSVQSGSGLAFWLDIDTYYADNELHGAKGYIDFKGIPINPFVVPGGETVKLTVSNHPPTYRLVDNLKAMGTADDIVAQYIEIFPDYFNASVYDETDPISIDNARFLQQDTLDLGSKYRTEYEFELFVIDSLPSFISYDEAPTTIDDANGDIYVEYNPTIFNSKEYLDADAAAKYGGSSKYFYSNDPQLVEGYYIEAGSVMGEPRLVANFTDMLRFEMDINTDDEQEDYSPAAAGWSFKYGQTSYSFLNIATNNAETTEFDGIAQARPAWLANDYFCLEGTTTSDPLLVDFTTKGKLNVRIPAADATAILTPQDSDDNDTGYMTNDTIMTVVVNDGHSGIATKQYLLTINYQPEIITTALPNAEQDMQYNQFLNDPFSAGGARIDITDKNFDQRHRYVLVYDDPTDTDDYIIPVDPMFEEEAGNIVIDASMKTTPSWLKINSENGVLYGTPTIEDIGDIQWDGNSVVPIEQMVTVLVFDLINGVEMLSDIAQIPLTLLPRAYPPEIIQSIPTVCVEKGGSFTQDIIIRDEDLRRSGDTIDITIINPLSGDPVSDITVDPSRIFAADYTGTNEVVVTISSDNFTEPSNSTNGSHKLELEIIATSSFGHVAVADFAIGASEEVDFVADIFAENSNGDIQKLQFGISSVVSPPATVGDGFNNENVSFGKGKLDYHLCEYELPPTPPQDVFDARWKIPLRNGTLRNIHPTYEYLENVQEHSVYHCDFQAGGVHGTGSFLYPVTIYWNPNDVAGWNDTEKNPYGGTWTITDPSTNGQVFRADMSKPQDPDFQFMSSNIEMGWDQSNENWVITINRADITGFVIEYVFNGTGVNENGVNATEIINVAPNPVSELAKIQFSVLDPTNLTIDVLDNLGRVVDTIENNTFFANGVYTVEWNGRNNNNEEMSSGQYMVRLNANGVISTYPVVIVK